eukprot:7380672-Prymnesium_polylepis.2
MGRDLTVARAALASQLELGNLGLVNCHEHGVPVRLIRKLGKEAHRYDGLYDVVSYSYEPIVQANSHGANPMVYLFKLQRRAGQPTLAHERSVGFGGDRRKGAAKAAKGPLTDAERAYHGWKAHVQREKLREAKRNGELSRRYSSAEYRALYEAHLAQQRKRLKGA